MSKREKCPECGKDGKPVDIEQNLNDSKNRVVHYQCENGHKWSNTKQFIGSGAAVLPPRDPE